MTIRVLHILCDLSAGGAERLVLDLIRLKSPDIEATVATVQGLGPLESAYRAAGVRIVEGGRRRGTLGVGALARLVPEVRRADVVHTHLFAGDTWGRMAAILAGHRAVVTTEHNVNRDETWQRHVKRGLARVSARIVCVSEAAARYAHDVEGIEGVVVIPNGVDPGRFAPHPGGPGNRVLAVGRRVPQKGFDVLLEALPDGMILRVAGEGPFHRDHPRVEWLGRREDVPELLRSSDILAVPSRWEGFGLAALEGMAAGVAVVASDVDGLAEVVGDAGVLVRPEDPIALRSALEALRADPGRRMELGRRGRARVEATFTLRATVDRYEAIYRSLRPH